MPKISVIMPAYNAEQYIGEAMDSILGQTFGDFEFIILNDCSTDRTEEIILSYDDPRIVYLKNENNLGVAATLNRGLEMARGEYIARMDADDISLPQRFEKQIAYLDAHPEVAVLGTNIEIFNENGTISEGWFTTDPAQMRVDMFFACGLAHPSVMMRTAAIRDLGGYDPAYNGLEDYELWCRVLERHEITTLPELLLRYRKHSGQVTKNPDPNHAARMRALKIRQLAALGITPEQGTAYLDYCEKGRPITVEAVVALNACFVRIDEANAKSGRYDMALLSDSFRAILAGAAAEFPRDIRIALTKKCKFIRRTDVMILAVRKKVREFLNRS